MLVAVICAIAMLVGLVGVVAPFIPGLVIIWLAALVYGVLEGFGTTGIVCFALMTVMFIVGEALGYYLPGRAAGRAGAPAGSIALGALAACIGFFVIPVFGFMLGGILGVFLAELGRTKSATSAWSTTLSTLIGFGVSALAQLAVGLTMIITWLVWAFVN